MTGLRAELTYPSHVVRRKRVMEGIRPSRDSLSENALSMLHVKNGIQQKRNTPERKNKSFGDTYYGYVQYNLSTVVYCIPFTCDDTHARIGMKKYLLNTSETIKFSIPTSFYDHTGQYVHPYTTLARFKG